MQTNFVMAALQAGSRGTQACINAASTVSGIIGDLDTTIMFASAGTLSAEPDGGAFGDHRWVINRGISWYSAGWRVQILASDLACCKSEISQVTLAFGKVSVSKLLYIYLE